MISIIFHCHSLGQVGWHASLQTGESRVLRAEVTSYFRVNTLFSRLVGHEKVNNDEAYAD
jgi:hypothetical protein